MKKLLIEHADELSGTIRISGAKNAAVALIPAAIISDEETTICNLPEISDVASLEEILDFLNVKYKRATESITINPKKIKNKSIPEDIAKKLRASYYFMGALLAKYKHVEMNFPGGCKIGARPIDLHLKGFEKLGATITIKDDMYIIDAKELIGSKIYLDIASVGATINIMLAAVKAKGTTTIENAAREPEIINVATFLNSMGADITGAGSSKIVINGKEHLSKGFIEVIPDRIEAGTYTILGALKGNNLKIDNVIPSHLEAITSKLIEAGANIITRDDSIICNKSDHLKSVNIKTFYFPGFPTDLQQPFSTFLTQCTGQSTVEETIYENRFMHVPYLNKMGANIKVSGKKAKIKGITLLKGRIVRATDLRAGAALVIAAIIATGKTTINDASHILRGYEGIVNKLAEVGVKITLKDE